MIVILKFVDKFEVFLFLMKFVRWGCENDCIVEGKIWMEYNGDIYDEMVICRVVVGFGVKEGKFLKGFDCLVWFFDFNVIVILFILWKGLVFFDIVIDWFEFWVSFFVCIDVVL